MTEEDEEFERIQRRLELETKPFVFKPPRKEWVGLTDDEVYKITFALEGEHWKKIADAIEAKLKEKNT
jgi:hypothetical protein